MKTVQQELARSPASALGWKEVALSNQATAQSHQERWAKAEALLMMALPHVEAEEDEVLAEMIRRRLDHGPRVTF